MKRSVILLPLLILLCFARESGAQVTYDTNHIRVLDASLGDGTKMRFILRRVGRTHSGTKHFLGFQSYTSGTLSTDFLRSEVFTAHAGDSLTFHRILSIFAPGLGGGSTITDTSKWDSINHLFCTNNGYSHSQPPATYFDGFSSLKYIGEIRTAFGDTVIMSFDTINMYKNAAGFLRYVTTGTTGDIRKISLNPAVASGSVYLAFRIVSVLPSGSSLSYSVITDTLEFDRVGVSRYPVWSIFQDNAPHRSPALKRAPDESAVRVPEADIAILSVSPNPAATQAVILVQTSTVTQLEISLIDQVGRLVERASAVSQVGLNHLPLDLTKKLAGTYHLLITNGTHVAQYPITILNH